MLTMDESQDVLTEMASRLGVSLNSVVNWVKVHKMPNPTKGAKFERCMDWVAENQDKLALNLILSLVKYLQTVCMVKES